LIINNGVSEGVQIYTDGACRGNPGLGGWGVLILAQGNETELCGAEALTTNNRMELQAAIKGLEAVSAQVAVAVFTDSTYVRNGILDWVPNWKRNGWRTAARKPVKNQDLWQVLDQAILGREVSWHWVRGHSGHPQNERADALANQAIDAFNNPSWQVSG
jgi:ribonuclease HI